MKKVLVGYFSTSGKTEKMAEYIAEGVRFNAVEAVVKKMNEIEDIEQVAGYDGYILGSPTFSLDTPEPVKRFLEMIKKINLAGKPFGTFGPYTHDVSYRHDDHAPSLIFNILQNEHKMKPFELGPFSLKENIVDTTEGMKACHDYGRMFGAEIE